MQGTEAMGTGGIEIDAVAFLQDEDFVLYRQFQRPFNNDIKLLTVMGVLVMLLSIGQRIHCSQERIDLTTAESTGKTLIFIVVATVDLWTLTSTREVIAAHAGLLAEEEDIEINAVLLGNLTQPIDRRVCFARFYLEIMVEGDATEICYLLGRNVKDITETFQTFSDLLDCFFHVDCYLICFQKYEFFLRKGKALPFFRYFCAKKIKMLHNVFVFVQQIYALSYFVPFLALPQ